LAVRSGSILAVTLLALISCAAAQTPSSSQQDHQNLPDAPAPKGLPAPDAAIPGEAPLPAKTGQPAQPDAPPPETPITGKTQSQVPPRGVADPNQLDTVIRVNVNLRIVPVTVTDNAGKIVQGLQQEDFAIYENGVKQQIKYFSSDPFPLSTAIVIDTGLPDTTLNRVKDTLRALGGAFGPYDEAAIFSYGGTVTQQSDFGPVTNARFADAIDKINKVRGQANGGVPVTSGPMASGPMVNNHPIDPTTNPNGTNINAPPANVRVSRVMNDALLSAAQALGRRDRARRKLILVISDGREYNSRNSYSDVLKVILNDEIIVDGIALDASAVPFFDKLQQIHLPTQGYTDLLPKYVNATGGSLFRELSRNALEQSYIQATFSARYQYTIGYSPKTPNLTGEYRQFEVRVHRTGLKVFAPDGYFSLPQRQ
jgi:VWFA-related protein